MADEIGLHYTNGGGNLTGIGRGSIEVWIADVQTFQLGDETIKDTRMRVAPLGKHMTEQRVGSRIPVAAIPEPEMFLGLDSCGRIAS
jgi:hypothetical protein